MTTSEHPQRVPPASVDGTRCDVAVIGGGVVGSATAWQLLERAPGASVVVLEPDPGYTRAASPLASGVVRQLFTRPENVLMSRYTHEVIDTWTEWVPPSGAAYPEDSPDLSWRPDGYLFLTEEGASCRLRAAFDQQLALSVEATWLEPDEVGERYPLLAVRDLGPAVLSQRDGWLDPHAFLDGMARRARRLGAVYVSDRAIGFDRRGRRITGIRLESGVALHADHVVNAAGVWGPGLSASLGLVLPVEPMRRLQHYVRTTASFAGYPFVKDPHGLAMRPEGPGLAVSVVDFSAPGGWDLGVDAAWFEDVVWPALVERAPETDRLKLVSTWSGHYDQNRLDANMILDRWRELDNYYLATGFSGHGLMHSPAVGRALAELILQGSFQTIDLGRMGLARVMAGEPYREEAIR